jgi:hypothetical protein
MHKNMPEMEQCSDGQFVVKNIYTRLTLYSFDLEGETRMKRMLYPALCAFALTCALSGSAAFAQDDEKPARTKPAPVVIRLQAHSMGANDFMVRRSKDRSIEAEIKNKGLDVAYTEWMQRDHPYVFAKECVKQVGEVATKFKSTNHMVDFDTLLPKRADLRLQAEKYGHDVAFAEWLRTERPDVYRQHFGLDANNKPLKK